MNSTNFSFIGAGNIGSAILESMIEQKIVDASNIYVSDVDKGKLHKLKTNFAVESVADNKKAVSVADIVFLCVKYDVCEAVLEEIYDNWRPNQTLVFIVLGWSTGKIRTKIPSFVNVIKVLPNTPMLVGEGATLISDEHNLDPKVFDFIIKLFSSQGLVMITDECLFNAAAAINYSGPAFLYIMAEAMADTVVKNGLPRDVAYELLSQTMAGAAKLMQQTGKSPNQLKNEICSPGDTNIDGIIELEKSNFRAGVINAVQASIDRAAQLKSE